MKPLQFQYSLLTFFFFARDAKCQRTAQERPKESKATQRGPCQERAGL